jgi:peptidoglycan hydrolase-like protein with peptidoglycan-binding domain
MVSLELPELQEGSVGDPVKAAQILLGGWGYTCGWYGADGEFGTATKQACINFQFSRKLEADGIIGPDTWAALLGVSG